MIRWLSLSALLLTLGIACLSQAPGQMIPLTGAGGKARVAGPSYTGPGDVTSFMGWWGLRCYNAAYSGNVADVYAPADASHTLITCSAGGALNETVQALSTTCATSCTVKTLYDQSGANSCGGAACNMTDLGFSSIRPSFITSCINSKPCMRFASASSQELSTASTLSQAQPLSLSAVGRRTANTTATQSLIGTVGTFYFGFANASNTAIVYYGGAADIRPTANDNTFHTLNGVANGASSSLDIDGSTTAAGGDLGSNGISSGATIGAGVAFLDGDVTEAGIKGSAFSAGNTSALVSNQTAYWGPF